MNSIAGWVGATVMAVSMAAYPQKSIAGDFTGREFLERSLEDQRGYISTQLVMASSIAARIKPQLSDCIGEAFFQDGDMSDESFQSAITRIAEFEDYHPSSVLVVVIESQCGSFN